MARLRYRVDSIKKTSFLRGRLTSDQLERKLNEAADEGWTFDRALAGETLLMGRDQFLLVFHRND